MTQALIALGANLGDRATTLSQAVELLRASPGIEVRDVSRWHATPPIGGPAGQGEFLNGAAVVETSLSAEALLARLHGIEASLGRTRGEHWAARTLDLDLLLYGDAIIDTPTLRVPHPRMSFRRFVLEPAAEVAAEMVHPELGLTIGQLQQILSSTPKFVAITGHHASEVAALIAERQGGRLIHRELPSTQDFAAAESSGPEHSSPLEFLRQLAESWADDFDRRKLIATDWSPESLLISDFWFRSLLALAKCRLSNDQLATFLITYAKLAERIVTPRLVVVLETAKGEVRVSNLPVLTLPAGDLTAAVEQIEAAIAAMQ